MRPILALLSLLGLASPLAAELRLKQEAVLGFPVDWIENVLRHDVPGEAHSRLVVTQASYLMGLEWSPRRNAYEQSFFVQYERDYPFNPRAAVADADGDADDDLVVFDDDAGRVALVYDAMNGALLKKLTIAGGAKSVAAQDLDGAPGDELIVVDDGVSAYRGGVRLWHAAVPSAIDVAAGGEESAGRDIVVRTAEELVVLEPATGAVRRRLPVHCETVAVGQSDPDTSLEIACTSIRTVTLLDSTTGAVQWSRPYNSFNMIPFVTMIDAGGDGRQDVAVRVGDYLDQAVVVLDAATGEPLAGPKKFSWNGRLVAVRDGCGSALVVMEGERTSFPDVLHLLDPETLAEKTAMEVDTYGGLAVAVADLDLDGRNELLVHHGSKITTVRVKPFTTVAEVKRLGGCCSLHGMATAQLDRDAPLEYAVSGGWISAYDGATHAQLWTTVTDDGETARSVAMGDLNGDGLADVVTGTTTVHSGAKGTFVYAYDGASGQRLWRSVNIPGLTGDVAVVAGDGGPEVLALSRSVGIVHLSPTGTARAFDEFTGGNVFVPLNADTDAAPEILVATDDALFILDQGQRVKEVKFSTTTPDITLMRVADVDDDGAMEILLARRQVYDRVLLEIRSAATLATLWTSEDFPLVINFGQQEDIAVADVDDDGKTEVIFLSSLTVRVFSVGEPLADTTAPQFASGAALQTSVQLDGSCCAEVQLRWDAVRGEASAPVAYRIYRRGPSASDAEELIARTTRTEYADGTAAGAARYRYSVAAVDASGNVSAERIAADVVLRDRVSNCRRRAVRR